MPNLTAENLVAFIRQLPRNRDYNYINPATKGLIRIVDIQMPEGPIYFKRWDPSKGETAEHAEKSTISTQAIWRYANAFSENMPVHVDRVFGASYNNRSVLESLVAHTPQFYYCYPGRIEDIAGNTAIKRGHKHLLWLPSEPHQNGKLVEKQTSVAISEIPAASVMYDSLQIPDALITEGVDINVARRHTQIQIALYLIGLQLGFRTWIAQNDKGIIYNDKPLIEQTGIVKKLRDERLVYPFDGAEQAGLFIDCIWFKNSHLMPAVMEVEHSTGVTSGLARMLNFKSKLPQFPTKYVIVAPDDDRQHVVTEANKEIFKPLNAQYFPYSAVEELYYLCQRRNLRGVSEDFIDCFMESVA